MPISGQIANISTLDAVLRARRNILLTNVF
jgi:hypothetical protein